MNSHTRPAVPSGMSTTPARYAASRWALVVTLAVALPGPTAAQHMHHGADLVESPSATVTHQWKAHWMAQVFPLVTAAQPFGRDLPVSGREAYLTQPAVMANVESPGARWVLRTTLDFEQFSQPDGEYTFGGWGEGFIDKRHPHTIVHEFMLSVNAWKSRLGAFSLSAGKGFAPYGTEDPMGRPVVKYPTNHHLSQILERWTLNGVWAHDSGWSLEGGLFGGAEPEDAYDMSNVESFGDSWSTRLTKRFGDWEAAASVARVTEAHGGVEETTGLANGALRYSGGIGHSALYALLEGSRSDPEEGEGHWSVLAEAQLSRAGHQPYARVEVATRPEFHRNGAPGTPEFFRYDHDTHSDGATRWVITTMGYGFELAGAGSKVASRPFVEIQHHRVSAERGDVDMDTLFGARSFWAVSAGFRLFFGGGPMRMGTYGVLDPISVPDSGRHHH